MANSTSLVIRPLGQLVAALSHYGQQLYQPPKDTIRGVEPDTWYSPLQPVKPIGPAGIEPRGFQYYAGQNLLWTPRADAEYSAADLKQMATYPLARIAIENVKAHPDTNAYSITNTKCDGNANSDPYAHAYANTECNQSRNESYRSVHNG